jgi:uncharacterized protein YjcR
MQTRQSKFSKKMEVQKLYLDGSKTAKEISAITKVTEKTISLWAKRYQWKAKREIIEAKALGLDDVEAVNRRTVIARFKRYMQDHDTGLYKQVLPLLDDFLTNYK